jgi:hypothetical protein
MRRRIVLGTAAGALAVGVAGGGVAVATGATEDDGPSVTGPQADRATAAALEATGGGTANAVERDGEDGATWEVEVTKPNGATVDVRLDARYDVVVVEGDSESPDDGSAGDG